MYLNGYIREFGKYSFAEHPFNDVDALVLAEISYLNLDLVLNKESDGSILLKNIDLSNIDDLVKQQSDTSKNKVMLPLLMKSKRFKDLIIRDVVVTNDNNDVCQFYAMTIFFEDRYYIAFRGTDLTLRGWKEDLQMTYNKIIPGQHAANKYINSVVKKYPGKFYIGGHSKGGNLAVYAAFRVKEEHQNDLVHIYSFDGPGFSDETLLKEIEESPIYHKIIKYVPRETVVGIMLKHTKIAKIIKAKSSGVFQHDPFNWEITEEGKFKLLNRRATISLINERSLNNWLDGLSKKDLLLLTDLFFSSFEDLGTDLIYIKDHWWESFRKIQTFYKSLDKKDRNRLRDIGVALIKSNAKSTAHVLREKAQNNIKKMQEKSKVKAPVKKEQKKKA